MTRTGDMREVRSRSFPMGGIDAQQIRSPASQAIPLSRLPSGETRMLAISRVYRTNPIVFACVHLLARNISSIPLRTYTHDSEGERRRIRSDVPPAGPGRPPAGIALDSLAQSPAPRKSRRSMVFRNILDLAIFGNALGSFDWGDYGPTELWPIPWRRVVVKLSDPQTVNYWEAWGSTGKVFLDPEHTIHWSWGDDPESPIGVSPIESLQYTIALHNAIDRHLVSYYGNAARPAGILKLQRMPDQGQVDNIREQFKQLYTAPESAGNVIITSAEYQPIAEATGVPTLAQLIELSREEILGVYGVDPPMIGVLKNAIKANFSEAREKFVMDTLGPWTNLWEDEANAQMVGTNPLWNYHWWEFDLDERMRPDLASMAEIMTLLQPTWTTNERRRKFNLPKLKYPEADTVQAPSGTYPLGIGTPTTITDLTPDTPDGKPADDDEDEDETDEGADADDT